MTKNNKIQITLIFVGLVLILATYLFYPGISGKVATKKMEQEKNIEKKAEMDSAQSNTFENVEYKGSYSDDNPFSVKSESAYILNEDSDIIYMDKMKATIYMNDGRIITITSDRGKYSKLDSNMWFVDNVRATDGKTVILSGNLDLLASEDTASIYNNVSIASPNGTLKSDKIDYNFETKYYKATMMTSEEKVKVKIVR
tara:strand:- start:325 stop:921 length:597 start_codon:yes stop_codon:yes gene_type:complete